MFNTHQQTILTIGAILGADNKDFDPALFQNMDSIAIYINDRYDIKIIKGMAWDMVLEEVRNGIAKRQFDRAQVI